MYRVLETYVVVVPGQRLVTASLRASLPHLFSKNVFAFTIFFPIALAFHAQNEPEGSTWYKLGPRVMSHPATNSETPYGRTPLIHDHIRLSIPDTTERRIHPRKAS